MNQANVTKLIPQLKFKVTPRHKLRNIDGPEGRLLKIRKSVTALIKHERLELYLPRGQETRLYAERLISEAILYGDTHKTTMEMADYFLLEKALVHKLFKVLVPRFEDLKVSYTKMYKAPKPYPGNNMDVCLLELRGNPFPPLEQDMSKNRHLIHNVLLDAAKQEYRLQKYAEIAENISKDQQPDISEAQPVPENVQKEQKPES